MYFAFKNYSCDSEHVKRTTKEKKNAETMSKSDNFLNAVLSFPIQAQPVLTNETKMHFSQADMQTLLNYDVTRNDFVDSAAISIDKLGDLKGPKNPDECYGRLLQKTEQHQSTGKAINLSQDSFNGMFHREERWKESNGCKSDKILGLNIKHEKRITPVP